MILMLGTLERKCGKEKCAVQSRNLNLMVSILHSQEPVEVLPWLFIGSLKHALQLDNLSQLGMSALINMAASTETSPTPSAHLIYKNIPICDNVTADILQWFPDAIHFIGKSYSRCY